MTGSPCLTWSPPGPFTLAPGSLPGLQLHIRGQHDLATWSAHGHGTDLLGYPRPTGPGTPEHQQGTVAPAAIELVKKTNGTANACPTGPIVPGRLERGLGPDGYHKPTRARCRSATWSSSTTSRGSPRRPTRPATPTTTACSTRARRGSSRPPGWRPPASTRTSPPSTATPPCRTRRSRYYNTDDDANFGAAPEINIVKLTNGTIRPADRPGCPGRLDGHLDLQRHQPGQRPGLQRGLPPTTSPGSSRRRSCRAASTSATPWLKTSSTPPRRGLHRLGHRHPRPVRRTSARSTATTRRPARRSPTATPTTTWAWPRRSTSSRRPTAPPTPARPPHLWPPARR